MIADQVNTNRGICLRVAAVLYFLSLLEWLEWLPNFQHVLRERTLPIRHAFGQTFHAMDGPIMQAWGLNANIALIPAFSVLSAFGVLAGYWLWKRQRRGAILALVLLPVYWFFAIGWRVHYMLLLGALKAIALAFGWKSLNGETA